MNHASQSFVSVPIEDALITGDPSRSKHITLKLKEAQDLPTLPTLAMEVSRLANDPLAGMSEIVRIIRNDPSMTSKILRVSNSAFYGMPRRVESLNMALVVLGMREVSNLVTSISVFKAFPVSGAAAGFSRETFWEHSAGTGEIARVLASKLQMRLHGIEFTSGLLHNIGKIVLFQYFPNELTQAFKISEQESLPSIVAEQKVLGTDHAEVGAWLAEKWSLPDSIVESIRYHHQPHLAPEHSVLTAIVHLASSLARAILAKDLRERVNTHLSQDPAWEVLAKENPAILSLDISAFVAEIEENIDRAREFIRMATTE
ncbi:MAG: HDOD domain-containing protein [Calditrichaeota bacterium]|nr:HDOD domain-containing protein [Calditrichota bacterium]MCB9365740.1 HDOD domain-containing protein [Calditrichota bacterium]